jgi:hypothetical protein
MTIAGGTVGVPGTAIFASCGTVAHGSEADSNDVNTVAQSAMNDLATIKSGNHAFGGNKTFSGTLTFSPAVSVTRVQGVPYGLSGAWTPSATTAGIVSAGTGQGAAFEAQPPHGSTLTDVRVWILPAGGHAALPGTMPTITLATVHNAGGVTTIGASTDTSLNVTAYQNNHAIALTGLSHVVDRSAFRYVVFFAGEASANAVNGLLLYYCELTYSVGAMGID